MGDGSPETVFINDDDEDLDLPDEWLDDSGAAEEDPQILHASHIQLQLNLCFFLLCCLLLLTMLILCAWRKYGNAIAAAQRVDQERQDKEADKEATKASKKNS